MKLIGCLGNIGNKYVFTRHNVGFMLADSFALNSNLNFREYPRLKCLMTNLRTAYEDFLIVKPTTFMNLSGNSVGKVANFYKIHPQNIIVIHDDKDLALGKLKAKIGGSAGGHNGLKNIDSQIGQEYNRIRIGVGSPQEHNTDTVNFVLSRFSKAEMDILQERLDFIAATVGELIKKGVAQYSNLIGMHNHG